MGHFEIERLFELLCRAGGHQRSHLVATRPLLPAKPGLPEAGG
jgi:hypothetical protein